jgi:hypothetical protein
VANDVADRTILTDSLQRAGLVVRPLDPANLWMALREADRSAPPGSRFLVFAPDLLRDFRGARPVLGSTVVWYPRPAADSGALSSVQRSGARVVTLYADPARRDDARYVTAALLAVGQATGIRAIVLVRSPEETGLAADADWVFWLSDRAIPEAIRRRMRAGTTLVSDADRSPGPPPHPDRAGGASVRRMVGAPQPCRRRRGADLERRRRRPAADGRPRRARIALPIP